MSALLRRELLRHLRRKRVIASVVLLGSLMVWVLAVSWPPEILSRSESHTAARVMSFKFIMIYTVAALLLLPGYTAMSIRSEHDGDTYELMRLSLLTPMAILIGTLANVVGVFLLALVATLPILMLSYSFAPALVWESLFDLGVVGATALMCACAGLYTGTKGQKTSDALGTAYGFALLAAVITMFLGGVTGSAAGSKSTGVALTVGILLIASAIFLVRGMFWLRRMSFERIREERELAPATLRERFIQQIAERPRLIYPDGRNPVFVREFGDALHRAQINVGSLLATVVLSVVLFAWTVSMVNSGDFAKGVQSLQWYFVTTMLIAAATIPGISTPAWTNDRNSEMEEALDLTLLTRRERFIGRACAAAALPFIVTACWGFGFGPVLVNATKSASAGAVALIGAGALAATLLNLLALGRRIARTSLSTPAAVVLVHLIAIAYIVMPYMAMPRHNDAATLVQLGTTAISPIAAVVCAVHSVRHQPAIGLYAYLGVFTAIQFLFLVVLVWGDVRPEWKTRKVIQ